MSETLMNLIATHGYWIVAAVVALESSGLPVPGETMLVAAAIYAGTTHQLNIGLVIASAATGAIVGDNVGFWIGRTYGTRLLLKHGHLLRITPKHIKLGQYLFHHHGGKVVFAGRFIAVLRALAALLAGINCMGWWRFLFFNATGGVVWATVFGMGAYTLGERVETLEGPVAYGGLALAIIATATGYWFLKREEARLEVEAERELPGPVQNSPYDPPSPGSDAGAA